ncbi:MAG: PEGA domain-containing protein, partial [Spirochaetia bacterium]
MGPRSVNPRRLFFILAAGCCFLSLLGAEPDAGRARIALFQPAGQKEDKTLAAVLCAMADCMELSLDVLQRYEVRRLPPADPAKDLERVCAYCQENRIDQAILGSGDERPGGGYRFRLVVYDRKSDSITTDRQGGSRGVLDMFAATDALLASLLKDLSGAHLIFGSLSVKTDPEGAMVSVDGKDVGQAPLSLRGLPVGTVELAARSEGLEEASATVTIVEGETTNASLKLSERQDAAAAGRSGEVGQNTLRNGDRLPKASISIDGKFDEWN